MIRTIFLVLLCTLLLSCDQSSQQSKPIDHAAANKLIIDQYFQHFNRHEWQKMVDMYIDEPEMKDPAYGRTNRKMTKAAILAKYMELHQMIPDVQDRVISMLYSGDQVVVEFESYGTAPNGSAFVLPICAIFQIKGGKIIKDLTYYDNSEVN